MARTKAIEIIEVPITETRPARLVSQQIDYIALPGKNITEDKIALMQECTSATAEILGRSLGFDVVSVNTERL